MQKNEEVSILTSARTTLLDTLIGAFGGYGGFLYVNELCTPLDHTLL
jgi:hypothetical protein